jgi:hypothetical protein
MPDPEEREQAPKIEKILRISYFEELESLFLSVEGRGFSWLSESPSCRFENKQLGSVHRMLDSCWRGK